MQTFVDFATHDEAPESNKLGKLLTELCFTSCGLTWHFARAVLTNKYMISLLFSVKTEFFVACFLILHAPLEVYMWISHQHSFNLRESSEGSNV